MTGPVRGRAVRAGQWGNGGMMATAVARGGRTERRDVNGQVQIDRKLERLWRRRRGRARLEDHQLGQRAADVDCNRLTAAVRRETVKQAQRRGVRERFGLSRRSMRGAAEQQPRRRRQEASSQRRPLPRREADRPRHRARPTQEVPVLEVLFRTGAILGPTIPGSTERSPLCPAKNAKTTRGCVLITVSCITGHGT